MQRFSFGSGPALLSGWWAIMLARLDAVGMYRTVSGALLLLAVYAFILSIFGGLPYHPAELAWSFFLTLAVGLIINYLLARVLKIPTNHESALITALIVFFLILPASLDRLELSFISAMVVTVAMLSKYIITWRKQHIFNPVALGVLAVMVVYEFFPLPPGYFESVWWVGQPALFVPLIVLGLVVVHKVRKWVPVGCFLAMGLVIFLIEEWRFAGDLSGWSNFFLSGPSIFLAVFMLTEPFTMPSTKSTQAWYGTVVGFLSQTTLFLPFLKMTPEIALLIGNLVFWPSRLRQKLFLKLIEQRSIAKDTFEFSFTKPAGLVFRPGQYLEWMLPHQNPDSRGLRRYFTIASSPTEDCVRLACKVLADGSSFKKQLLALKPGEQIIASQLAGDFLLPVRTDQKIGLIAGGIGVTPFHSHLRYMVDTQKHYDTKLIYCTNTQADLAYGDEFLALSQQMKLEVIPIFLKELVGAQPGDLSNSLLNSRQMSWPLSFECGLLTAEILARRVPDYRERIWYISGPPSLVTAYAKLLRALGVPRRQIKKDFFPGLA